MLLRALVPGLLLQPLLENAIYDGIEPQPAGGVVHVGGELSGGLVTIVVRNHVADGGRDREGNRLDSRTSVRGLRSCTENERW